MLKVVVRVLCMPLLRRAEAVRMFFGCAVPMNAERVPCCLPGKRVRQSGVRTKCFGRHRCIMACYVLQVLRSSLTQNAHELSSICGSN